MTGEDMGVPGRYRNIRQISGKKSSLSTIAAGSALAKVTASIDQIESQLTANAETSAKLPPRGKRGLTAQASVAHPVPVQVVKEQQHGLFNSLGLVSTSFAHFLGGRAAVIVLTLFILVKREHLRNRLFRLMGQERLVTMTTALDDAAAARQPLSSDPIAREFHLRLVARLRSIFHRSALCSCLGRARSSAALHTLRRYSGCRACVRLCWRSPSFPIGNTLFSLSGYSLLSKRQPRRSSNPGYTQREPVSRLLPSFSLLLSGLFFGVLLAWSYPRL